MPAALGCCGKTCWRRLQHWQAAGVYRVLLEQLHEAGGLDWSRAALDGASVPAKKGGEETGPNPTVPPRCAASSAGRPGSKRHLRRRRARHAARPDAERGPSQRQHDAGAHPRCGAGRAHRTPRPSVPPAGQAACRQGPAPDLIRGLRPSPVPDRVPGPFHRPTRHRKQRQARAPSLGRRAHLRLAGPLPPPHRPLRATGQHPPRPDNPRLHPHLPQANQTVLSLAL